MNSSCDFRPGRLPRLVLGDSRVDLGFLDLLRGCAVSRRCVRVLSRYDSRGGERNEMRACQTRDSAESESSVLSLEEIDKTQVALAGGKGANLGELSRIEGIHVPAGFCVTTDAFRRIMTTAPGIDDQLGQLSRLDPCDRQAIRTLSAEMRRTLEGIAIPDGSGGGDHPLGRPARRASCLRRAVQRDGGGLADGFLRGPAGHVPERRGAGCDPQARQPLLGLAVHRAGRDLPPAERFRPPEGPDGRGRAADGRSRRRPASCSRPTPSPPTGRSSPSRPASASARPWSPAW